MSSRIVIPSLMVLALGLGGCAAGAAGGGGGGAAAAAAQIDTDNLPEWALALPEGTPPRDNDQTNEAAVALFQASSTPDPARMATFFQDALAMAEAGIAADPGNPQSYFQAGEAHLGLGNLGEAGQAFDRAEELYPLYVLDTRFLREEAWIDAYNEGVAVVESDPAAAQPHFERAHAAYRGRPEAMFQLGQFYIEQARNSDAIEVYSQALEAIQSPVGREGIDPEPLAAWDAAVQPILFSLGQLYMSEQRYAEAIETYDEILESNPGDLTATSNLAGALVSEGETERANAVLNQLLSRTDLSSRQSFAVGLGLFEADQYAQAARAFGQASVGMPGDHQTLFMHAQSLYFNALEAGGSWQEVIPVAERLLTVDTHSRNSILFLYQALSNIQSTERANEVAVLYDGLPFEVTGLQLETDQGAAAVGGQVTNLTSAPGTSVTIRITFFDENGAQVGTGDTTLSLGGAEEFVDFQVDASTTGTVAGYRYEVVN